MTSKQYFATRSGAAALTRRDYRTVQKHTAPDALLVRKDGSLIPLFAVDPVNSILLSDKKYRGKV
jgi:hypothetical protein